MRIASVGAVPEPVTPRLQRADGPVQGRPKVFCAYTPGSSALTDGGPVAPQSGGPPSSEIAMRCALTLIVASASCLAAFGLAACSRNETTTAGLMGGAPDAAARDQTTAVIKAIDRVKDVDKQLRVESKS